jgi:hypothetical protein
VADDRLALADALADTADGPETGPEEAVARTPDEIVGWLDGCAPRRPDDRDTSA